MGYIRHNAIVVTSSAVAQIELELIYKKAIELFEGLVSPVIKSERNGYQSFLIAPDGSNEDWGLSDEFDRKRKDLADYIDSMAYEDGSNSIKFLDAGFNDYEANIDRTNRNNVMENQIIKAKFITMIPVEMKKYEDIPIHFSNELKTEFYSLYDTNFCDKSDLAGLNIDLKANKITFLLDISSSEIGLNEGWTHIIKDGDGFYFAVEIN